MTNKRIVENVVTCRLMEVMDIDAVAVLFIRRFQSSARLDELSDDEVKRESTFEREQQLIKVRLDSSDKGVAVACLSGAVVGFILYTVIFADGHYLLKLDYVARDGRLEGLGIASSLIRWLIEFVKSKFHEKPLQGAYLMVGLFNDAAITRYRRLGFQPRERSGSDLRELSFGWMDLDLRQAAA
jgi:GNAT superfamily N-acetyltransferase